MSQIVVLYAPALPANITQKPLFEGIMVCVFDVIVMNTVDSHSWLIDCDTHFLKTFETHVSCGPFEDFWNGNKMNMPVDHFALIRHCWWIDCT
ncbi:hypothetical protein BpHYR1_030674 [Brachionus plicatilis]|uniref:Uncharacterized protein n=1 Tax=Brachionus plicatilis TaxID=10195 RepID=A0A3M7R8G3_BRAPC|nr:hypothetical protein BpHYR1_030674 [Brachionus plicatilis]